MAKKKELDAISADSEILNSSDSQENQKKPRRRAVQQQSDGPLPVEAAPDAPKRTRRKTPETTSDGTAPDAPKRTRRKTSETTSDGTAPDAPKRARRKTPETTSDGMAPDAPKRARRKTPETTSDGTAPDAPKRARRKTTSVDTNDGKISDREENASDPEIGRQPEASSEKNMTDAESAGGSDTLNLLGGRKLSRPRGRKAANVRHGSGIPFEPRSLSSEAVNLSEASQESDGSVHEPDAAEKNSEEADKQSGNELKMPASPVSDSTSEEHAASGSVKSDNIESDSKHAISGQGDETSHGASEMSVQDDKTSEINLLGGRKMSRPRGRMVRVASNNGNIEERHVLNSGAVSEESRRSAQGAEGAEPAAFVPKKVDRLPLERGIGIQPSKIVGMIHPPYLERKFYRRRGQSMTSRELAEREAVHSGIVKSSMQDRAAGLGNVLSAYEVNPPIPRETIEAFKAIKRDTVLWSRFESVIAEFFGNSLTDRYHRSGIIQNDDRNVYAPDPGYALYAAYFLPLFGRIERMPVQNEAQEQVVEASDDEPENKIPELTEEDIIIQNIFSIFDMPIVPMISHGDRAETEREHIDNHMGRVTTLLCDWARSLRYIDSGVTGGRQNKLLSVCFIEYFEKICTINAQAALNQGIVLPDAHLREVFHLDTIDMIILWMLVGMESNPVFRDELTSNWNQQTVVFMSAGTVMRFMASTAGERTEILRRMSPSGWLVTSGLVRMMPNSAPTMPLYYEMLCSEQVRNLFCGVRSLSLSSTLYAELLHPHLPEDTFVGEVHEKTFDIVRNYYERPALNHVKNLDRDNLDFVPSMAFLIEGLPGSGRTTLVKAIASRLGKPVIVVQCNPLSAIHPNDCEDFLKSVFADALIMECIICLRDAGTLLTDERLSAALARQFAKYSVVCAMCVDLAVKTLPVIDPYITFKAKMNANLRDNAMAIWRPHLALPNIDQSSVDTKILSQSLALQPFQIQKAAKLAYYSTNADEQDKIVLDNKKLVKAASVQVTKNIGNLAFVSDPEITLDDVIVSDDIMEKIQQIIGSAINRRRVLYEWGLSRRIRRGTGVIALFDGEPGTGKTHSAEAIAKSLGLSLMRINIATMVDKYIGETEKNLTTIFEQARPDMQLLLFDEADSLFTKRTSNVSKSNDRYSNMSVNVLLQLVERYEGVSILTTNLKNAIDPAFERRITYKVYFPMPKKPERERLWQYMCPPDILTSEPIDYEWLSELEMSGGEIKNAVLTAAFQAATKGVLLNSEILYDAGVSEASAAGRVMRRYDENIDDMFS